MAQSHNSISLLETASLAHLHLPRVAIVYTEWNDKIVREQINGAESMLHRLNGEIIKKIPVPGSFELPFGCRAVWQHFEHKPEKPEAIIAFGAVIRGGTPHFEYVCQAVTDGITQLNVTLPIPVIFGVLTLDTEEQAWERLGGPHGHKGEEAAITALKMIKVARELK
jgi:6,7-dimethyl-8-ribityllumazine synthase